ncbi:MAG TPA: FAD-dependent oxidoreductase [Lautropia sp.]|nr:FAD-dependent oxidoreductase [Lautropia sp.]
MQPIPPSTSCKPDADVLVAGGGVAGLTCAAALADLGLRVMVLERDERLGGRAASWTDRVTGDTVDIGPHVLTSEHRNFLALLQRMGTADQVAWQPEPLITLLDRGRRLRMHASRLTPPLHGLPNLRNTLRCVTLSDALSNWQVAWQAARHNELTSLGLDQQDALTYLKALGVSEAFIHWFWASSMLALLNVPLERCSAAALVRVFRLLLGRSGYCFGFPKVGLADLFVPGCRRAIEAAGGPIITSASVGQVLCTDGSFQGFVLEDGRQLLSRAGVMALPPDSLGALLRGCPEPALSSLAASALKCEPSPYVSTMLWFDRKLGEERFWARTISPDTLNTDFYDLSNIRDLAPGSPSLIVSNAIYAHAASRLDDDQLIARTRAEIAEFTPAAADARVLHARVHRIPMAIPCPLPGFETSRPPSRTAIRSLWMAGDWTATAIPCSMESSARSGALAAEGIAAEFGAGLRLAIAPVETTGLVSLLRRRGAPRRGFRAPRISTVRP